MFYFFFFQAEDGIRDVAVTGVQTCALPISSETWQLGDSIVTLLVRHLSGPSGGAAVALNPLAVAGRSEERRVGKSVDLGGRRIIKKKKNEEQRRRRY